MLCLIPARGGSQRVLGKNMKLFHGQPIIQYSINTAKNTGLFQEIIVSTDDPKTMEYCANQGCRIHYRGEFFSQDNVGTQEVAGNVITECGIQPSEVVCVLYATSPLLEPDDIREGMYKLFHTPGIKYSHSTDSEGMDAGNFYWGDAQSFLDQVPLYENSVRVHLPDERVCDINTIEDFERAEEMYGHK